jgi:hypothetical protein
LVDVALVLTSLDITDFVGVWAWVLVETGGDDFEVDVGMAVTASVVVMVTAFCVLVLVTLNRELVDTVFEAVLAVLLTESSGGEVTLADLVPTSDDLVW